MVKRYNRPFPTRGSKVLGGDNGAFIAWHEHFRSTESWDIVIGTAKVS